MFYIIPYFPCVFVLWHKPLIENSCFKIMACMSIPDLTMLLVSGPYCGMMSILGMPYDKDSWREKLVGAITNAAWWFYGILNVLLAFNR